MSEYPKVLGVLNGTDMAPQHIAAWVNAADVILAADGGANVLGRLGLRADTIIGDLDSLDADGNSVGNELIQDADQNTSDCDKLLSLAASRGYDEITLCNVEGDYPDHVLGSMQSAARSPLRVRLALRRGIAYVLTPGWDLLLQVPANCRVSLLPLEHCTGVTLSGVRWPLTHSALTPTGQTSLSNQAIHPEIQAQLESGAAVLFLISRKLETPGW